MSGKSAFGAPWRVVNGSVAIAGRVTGIDRWLLVRFLHAMGNPAIRATLWDGKAIATSAVAPVAGMVIRDRATLMRLVTRPLLCFGDDYSAGRIEIEGGLAVFMEAVYRSMSGAHRRLSRGTRRRKHTNSISGSRNNIHHHYDIGNDFYRLWLDKEMLYTCAFFPDPKATLEDAQVAKMDLVCRKLMLKAGQSVVEAGCGWGALALYMARHYRVKVRSFNISGEQIAYAREKARAEGMESQIEYIEDDYRNISGQYDAFVSVGMLEHVGPEYYREFGKVIDRSLDKQGIGLIHTIGQNEAYAMSPWLLKRIFPGSYPPTLREMMEILEPYGFSILDVENLRLHYAKTLWHWLERFEACKDRVAEMFDESFVRAWRLYLSGSMANFNVGALQLFQVVFTRPGNNRIPWTRSQLVSLPGVS